MVKDEDGKEMILTYLGQGDFFGEAGLFEEGQLRSAWIKAKSACEVAEISYRKFRQLIQANPEILMYLTAQLARRLQNTSRQVSNLAFLDVTGRIAQTLLNLAKMPEAMTHPDGMQIKITRQEIGHGRLLPRNRWPNFKKCWKINISYPLTARLLSFTAPVKKTWLEMTAL